MEDWVSSTLVFVRDVDAAIGFYVDRLGFTLNMRFEDEGQALVAGVSHGDSCALLLTCQWPEKIGTTVLYLAFGPDEFELLLADLEAAGVPVTDGWWGNPLAIVTDPDGNQLWFARPDRQ